MVAWLPERYYIIFEQHDSHVNILIGVYGCGENVVIEIEKEKKKRNSIKYNG